MKLGNKIDRAMRLIKYAQKILPDNFCKEEFCELNLALINKKLKIEERGLSENVIRTE